MSEFEQLEIDPGDILEETEDYFMVRVARRNPEFPNDEVMEIIYAVTNKLTGVYEAFLHTYPASFNWMRGLQEALDAIKEDLSGQQEFEFTSDPEPDKTLN
jgi:hypothetical protein